MTLATSKALSSFNFSGWQCNPSKESLDEVIQNLEYGKVIYLPNLAFDFAESEKGLLSYDFSNIDAKNISFIPQSNLLNGLDAPQEFMDLLQTVMARYARNTKDLVLSLLPHYAKTLHQARTSFRPIETEGRKTSYRKDDTLLHVDAFPSSPNQGNRILRVFTNINPDGKVRLWRLGEPFADLAKRFVPKIPAPIPGSHTLFNTLGITKTKRSHYDHIMLRMHNQMKMDKEYQDTAPQCTFNFPPGGTWLVFTDQASHAAMSGQHLLEQTFHIPVDGMLDPNTSPLKVLEGLTGKALAS